MVDFLLKDGKIIENFKFFFLKNFDFKFKVGKFNIVIGVIGSGKFLFLYVLLGEMLFVLGNVRMFVVVFCEILFKDEKIDLVEGVVFCV